MNDKQLMNRAADNIRVLAVSMVEKANSGHPGGAMGGADFINVLFSEFLVYDPDDPMWTGRDRFFLDPGHMSPMLYAALTLRGMFSMDDIKQFRQWGSPCPGHPELDVVHGIENSSGPLGQGHAIAAGAAVAEKFLEARLGKTMMQHTIYCYISDGAVEEEISQGVGRIAGTLGLNNLIMFYDANEVQLSTDTKEVMAENTAMKYKAWNWNVIEINGNDVDEIRGALREAQMEQDRPTLIIGHTVMAKGALKADGSSYEGSVKTHGAPLGDEAYRNTVVHLGGNPDDPFVIWDDVKQLYDRRREELRNIVRQRRTAEHQWRESNPVLAAQMDEWFSNTAPKVDFSNLVQKRDVATRVASSACLGELAKQVSNMICASADLSNSDKTDGFLKQTHDLIKGNFTGAFFQAGVAELTMADMCIGMALHGCIAACGTFFVFSDYMKPAVRLAALMGVPVKFIWSHDAFRVGEDGPTHQPVEQLLGLRSIPNLEVFRPADANEVIGSYKAISEMSSGPSVITLSRNKLPILETTNVVGVSHGGYVVFDTERKPSGIVIATGEEVHQAIEVAKRLLVKGIAIRVVSMPNLNRFLKQDEEYIEK